MAGRKLPIQTLFEKIKTIKTKFDLANLEILAKLGSVAELEAKSNSKSQFIGRGGRKLSGRLINSIFWKIGKHNNKNAAFVGTRGIPYGRIHEYGGKIEPKSAKFLWIRAPYANKGTFKNFTPKDFYRATKTDPEQYFYSGYFGGKGAAMFKPKGGKTLRALFFLKQSVFMPKRPYLTPAAEKASSLYKEYFNDIYGDLFKE